jgi:hypothetical protein
MIRRCNAAPPLPWAFESLPAQTSRNREGVLVEDDSVDCPPAAAVGLGDDGSRIF